jgi:hypothetical protein
MLYKLDPNSHTLQTAMSYFFPRVKKKIVKYTSMINRWRHRKAHLSFQEEDDEHGFDDSVDSDFNKVRYHFNSDANADLLLEFGTSTLHPSSDPI